MKKKLTLTIEASVKERAKRYARRSGTSVSSMVENYLKDKIENEAQWQPKEGSWTQDLLGSVPFSQNFKQIDYKKIKEKELQKKYGTKSTD